MSSIYDDAPESSQPLPSGPPIGSPQPEAPTFGQTPPFGEPTAPPPAKKSGCGCAGCFLGCLGVTVLLTVVGGIGLYVFLQRLPDLARQTIAKGVEQSDLSPDDKRMVMEQVDRLVQGYKQGQVDLRKMGRFFEDFARSPLMDLLIAFAAKVKYVDNSGLSPEEKQEAEKTLHRVARGVIEERITQEQLDVALNHISKKLANGQRQFKDTVSDDELRAFLKECKRLADEALVSNEEINVDIGQELKKLVDRTLGEAPEDVPLERSTENTENSETSKSAK